MKYSLTILIVLTLAIVALGALVTRIVDRGTIRVGEIEVDLREYRSHRESGPMPTGVRSIDIPFYQSDYSELKSQVIRSQKDLDSFFEKIRGPNGWNLRMDFIDAIKDARVDFDKEALVLLRHSGESGSAEVRFRAPRVSAKTMICDVVTRRPDMQTKDLIFYGAAFAVELEPINTVQLVVDGETIFTSRFGE